MIPVAVSSMLFASGDQTEEDPEAAPAAGSRLLPPNPQPNQLADPEEVVESDGSGH